MSFTLVPQSNQTWAWDKGSLPPWEVYFGLFGLSILGFGSLGVKDVGIIGVKPNG